MTLKPAKERGEREREQHEKTPFRETFFTRWHLSSLKCFNFWTFINVCGQVWSPKSQCFLFTFFIARIHDRCQAESRTLFLFIQTCFIFHSWDFFKWWQKKVNSFSCDEQKMEVQVKFFTPKWEREWKSLSCEWSSLTFGAWKTQVLLDLFQLERRRD